MPYFATYVSSAYLYAASRPSFVARSKRGLTLPGSVSLMSEMTHWRSVAADWHLQS